MYILFFCLAISSSSNWLYNSIPTSLIKPDWSEPIILPDPLISKSLEAILKPEPNSLAELIIDKRFFAFSFKVYSETSITPPLLKNV